MKLSPLQLLDYFVAEFHFSLNSKFDPKKNVEKKLEDIEATPGCTPIADKPRCWSISLELKYQPAADTNTPLFIRPHLGRHGGSGRGFSCQTDRAPCADQRTFRPVQHRPR